MKRGLGTIGIVAAAAALATVALALVCGYALGGWDFVRQHGKPLLAASACLVGLCTLVAKTVAGMLRGAVRAARRPRALGEAGVAHAEFVIVVIPFLLMLFGVMQAAMASTARLLTSYAAFCAARTAIVFVPADANSTKALSPVAQVTEAANQVGAGGDQMSDFHNSSKASLMRSAASYALIPASPAIDTFIEDVAHNWSGYWSKRLAAGIRSSEWFKKTVDKIQQFPQDMVDKVTAKLDEKVKDLSTHSADYVKKEVDDWLKQNRGSLSNAELAALEQAAGRYVDECAKNGAGSVTDFAHNAVNDALSGPLAQYHDAVNGAVDKALGAVGGLGGNPSDNASVARALDQGFASGTGTLDAIGRALRKVVYARMLTAVTLHDGSGNLKSNFGPNDAITARVTYLFYCQIPVANRIAGRAFYDLDAAQVGALASGPLGGAMSIGFPGYFMVFTAEHTLVNQGHP